MSGHEAPALCEAGDRCRSAGAGRAELALVVTEPLAAAKSNPPEYLCRECVASRTAGYARLGWGFHVHRLVAGEEIDGLARGLQDAPAQKAALDRLHRSDGPLAIHQLSEAEAREAPEEVPAGTIVARAGDGRLWVVTPDGDTREAD